MHFESYSFDSDLPVYQYAYSFTSTGKKGNILKVVYFAPLYPYLYNLVLGDYVSDIGGIDDKVISNNGDLTKILATTVQITAHFLHNNPANSVFIQANTELKQKLYHRILRNHYQEIAQDYIVQGILKNGNSELFNPDNQYVAFVVNLKFV